MSRRKAKELKSKVGEKASKSRTTGASAKRDEGNEPMDKLDMAKRERYFEIFIAAALFAFGVYVSIIYFGHKVVPNPDFQAWSGIARQLLSLKVPHSFKQAPVLGFLHVFLSNFIVGRHPDLTAGWLLNALLYPFNLILFWLIGRKIVGKSALWLALIIIIHPWLVYLLCEPIVETTLIFFSLLTFYFMFKRSSWCYLFASITTMTRYEGAALILAAFVMDMIYSTNRRQRIRAFLYSAAATLPLAFWLLGTALTWKPGTGHYLSIFTKEYAKGFVEPLADRRGVIKHMGILWWVGFQPLLMPYPQADKAFVGVFWGLNKILAAVSFFFGCGYGLYKRQWKILALLIFFVPYFLLHAIYPYPIPRFHAPVFWIALLLCWFGLQSFWKLINGQGRIPKAGVFMLQALVLITAAIWLYHLVAYLPQMSRISPTSAFLPWAAMALVTFAFGLRIYIYKFRYLLRELLILVLVCLIIVSNQFILAPFLRDGKQGIEFKLLADWYVANAKPGEKMASYSTHPMRIYAPEYAEYFIWPPKAENPSEFIKACYENNITYIVWATREGLSKDHYGYHKLGLDRNIAMLGEPRSIGPYEFITQLGSRRGYVNIFRLHKPH
jgi:hypothetical protein